jgi:hypothetical protein
MTVKIITPEGGTPAYHLAIALRGKIIGSLTFEEKNDLDHFLQMYRTITPLGYGYLQLNIDTSEDEHGDES